MVEVKPALSLPSRGAWIEIGVSMLVVSVNVSLPSRGAWIEILLYAVAKPSAPGRSPRGERG